MTELDSLWPETVAGDMLFVKSSVPMAGWMLVPDTADMYYKIHTGVEEYDPLLLGYARLGHHSGL